MTRTINETTYEVPSIAELKDELISLKRWIDDDMIHDGDTLPGIDVTLGIGKDGWGLQSGSNEYAGVAYDFPHWGVSRLYRRTNCYALAKELIDEAVSLAY
jgi:hypothetical protein